MIFKENINIRKNFDEEGDELFFSMNFSTYFIKTY